MNLIQIICDLLNLIISIFLYNKHIQIILYPLNLISILIYGTKNLIDDLVWLVCIETSDCKEK